MTKQLLRQYRPAFSEAFVRERVERDGLKRDFDLNAVFSDLHQELAIRGMPVGAKHAVALDAVQQRLEKTLAVTRLINSRIKAKRPVFYDPEPGEPDEHPVLFFDIRPYGVNLVLKTRTLKELFGDNIRGDSTQMSQDDLLDLLHPDFLKQLSRRKIALDDLKTVFSFSSRNKVFREHELEHSWSQVVSPQSIPAGEEIAAHYRDGLSAGDIILNLMSTPHILYRISSGIIPKGKRSKLGQEALRLKRINENLRVASLEGKKIAAAFLSLDRKNQEARVADYYQRIRPYLVLSPQLDKKRDESFLDWYERIKPVKFVDLVYSKTYHLEQTRLVHQQTGLSTHLVTSMLRNYPVESVPSMLAFAKLVETNLELKKLAV